jgi:ABC-type transport system substrate-binding protein
VRRLCLCFAMLLAGTMLLAAAFVRPAGGRDVAVEVRKGGTLRLNTGVDVPVDPALGNPSEPLDWATCAMLFSFAPAAGAAGTRVIPEVVDGWTVSRDGRTYTFELKRTFRFHTGAPVTARSFADAFNRVASPTMHSIARNYLREIVGASAVIDGKAETITGVQVLGRYRLRSRLTEVVGDLTARLAMNAFCPILPDTPIDPAGIDGPAGSGPYFVAERVVNRRIVLKRNPYYRGSRPANVDQIVFTVGPDPDACRVAVEQNRTDYCLNTAAFTDAAYRDLVSRYGINRHDGQFFVIPLMVTWYFAFNHDRAAFKGPGQIAVKKAINHAIDRPALARAFGYLAGRRSDQMLPPALGRDASVYPISGADPATARKWFAKARFQPAKLVLYAWTGRSTITAAQVFAFDLKQIGIDVEVKYFDSLVGVEKAATRGEPFDVVLTGWGIDYPDAASYFEPLLNGRKLRQTGNTNFSYFDDPQVNARIAGAGRLTGEARRRAWAALDADLMRNEPPWAPFINGNRRAFISKSFGCFLLHPVYGVDLAAACKK